MKTNYTSLRLDLTQSGTMQEIRNNLLQHLIRLHLANPAINFRLRERNDGDKSIENGYYFRGNDDYLVVTFWRGTDHKQKVYAINFGINSSGESFIEISLRGYLTETSDDVHTAYLRLYDKLKKYFGDNVMNEDNHYFQVSVQTGNYLASLEDFINKHHRNISNIIDSTPTQEIRNIDESETTAAIKKIGAEAYKKLKFARICWNNSQWEKPSGSQGKAIPRGNSIPFEHTSGFGYEEWLSNEQIGVFGPYKYAYLEPIGTPNIDTEGYLNEIALFSVLNQGNRTTRYWVGKIKNVELINKADAIAIYNKSVSSGMINQMKNDVKNCDGKWEAPNSEGIYFNCRFNPADLLFFLEPIEMANPHKFVKSDHYQLYYNYWGLDIFEMEDYSYVDVAKSSQEETVSNRLVRRGTDTLRSENTRIIIPSLDREISGEHGKLQNLLRELLLKLEFNDVLFERDFFDVSGKSFSGKKYCFEVKSHNDIRYVIRYAVGQLLEYTHWPPKSDFSPTEILIAGKVPLNNSATKYLEEINKTYNLNIGYVYLNLDARTMTVWGDYPELN